ncbi:NAD(P)/FAD-dependent oxidoreductase [Acuticoccus sp. I52.16.1]|uniref:NAD(P)/FAD-dependent oxidoreductase n=1 Tax=Acuticoccus sp. I52.16.1 TaxID=2928472 RepID=UPI001FD0D7C4|nr:NAD(P)/FAD-dependent oxidoreductase [Acuticoccus sp. I52.16.1]UOM36336.1 NAD(P)/FAD-dependent oxidoreductase [Acuticoccus sp. I52.16.1]
MTYDVLVIGGSYAGLSAALQLVRARRSVLVVDAGRRRNRFASHAHGFLGQDGVDPAEFARRARAELEAYPTLAFHEGEVTAASGAKDAFVATTADGSRHAARRILLATGVSDRLPPVEGIAERWGRGVYHCPYCHGYELDEGAIGVVGAGAMSLHQAEMASEWGRVTLLANGAVPLDAEARASLDRYGVAVEETPVARICGTADVLLQDGRMLAFAGLFTIPVSAPSSPVASELGCEIEETPFGTQIRTDATKETTVPGAFACGDVARVPHSLALAVGDGAFAGAAVHRSLVF